MIWRNAKTAEDEQSVRSRRTDNEGQFLGLDLSPPEASWVFQSIGVIAWGMQRIDLSLIRFWKWTNFLTSPGNSFPLAWSDATVFLSQWSRQAVTWFCLAGIHNFWGGGMCPQCIPFTMLLHEKQLQEVDTGVTHAYNYQWPRGQWQLLRNFQSKTIRCTLTNIWSSCDCVSRSTETTTILWQSLDQAKMLNDQLGFYWLDK